MRERRAVVFGVVVAVVLVAIALFAGPTGSADGPPLSPRSTAPDGTKALMFLLEQNGATVDLQGTVPPSDPNGVAFMLRDDLDDAGDTSMMRWVEGGGTLVVADPTSTLVPIGQTDVDAFAIDRGACDVAGLEDARQLVLSDSDVEISSVRYGAAGTDTSCYGSSRNGFVVHRTFGKGAVVAVGGQGPFTNSLLDEADNAVLATRLLEPGPGTVIAVYDTGQAGQGQTTLIDLMPERFPEAVIQAGIALLIYVLFRIRRLGAPVVEPQPVDIAGSELVRAVGSLHARSGGHYRAGEVLQTDTRRRLARRYRLPANAPPDVVAAAVSAHSTLDPNRVNAAIGHMASLDDEGLLALAQELDEIREEVLDGSS